MTGALNVAALILEARANAPLHEALLQNPGEVAQNRHLPQQVAESAACTLRELPRTKEGIWM